MYKELHELGLLLHGRRQRLVGAPLQGQRLVALAFGMFEQGHKGFGHEQNARGHQRGVGKSMSVAGDVAQQRQAVAQRRARTGVLLQHGHHGRGTAHLFHLTHGL